MRTSSDSRSKSIPTVRARGVVAPSERGVGSKPTQPWPSSHTSTQAWALRSLTIVSGPSGVSTTSPPVNPITTRVGSDTTRPITAIAAANCSQ